MPKRYYAVLVGRNPGLVYDSFEACQQEVLGYPGNQFKGFNDIVEAQMYLRNNGAQQSALSSPNMPGTTILTVDGVNICNPNNVFKMEFDGASRGNPGMAGAGATIYEQRGSGWHQIANVNYSFGHATSQQAEAAALVLGLEAANWLQIRRLRVFGDCEVTVKQTQGVYKIRNETLQDLHDIIDELRTTFDVRWVAAGFVQNHMLPLQEFCIHSMRREDNEYADRMAKQAADGQIDDGIYLFGTGQLYSIPNAECVASIIDGEDDYDFIDDDPW